MQDTGYIFCILTWIVTVCPPLPAAVGESQSLVSRPRSSPESSVHDVRDTPESHIVEQTLLSETLLKLWHQGIKRTALSVLDIVEGNLTLWNFRETMKPRRHRDTLHIEHRFLLLKNLEDYVSPFHGTLFLKINFVLHILSYQITIIFANCWTWTLCCKLSIQITFFGICDHKLFLQLKSLFLQIVILNNLIFFQNCRTG